MVDYPNKVHCYPTCFLQCRHGHPSGIQYKKWEAQGSRKKKQSTRTGWHEGYDKAQSVVTCHSEAEAIPQCYLAWRKPKLMAAEPNARARKAGVFKDKSYIGRSGVPIKIRPFPARTTTHGSYLSLGKQAQWVLQLQISGGSTKDLEAPSRVLLLIIRKAAFSEKITHRLV